MEMLSVPQGEFFLKRYPQQSRDLLRAWDAADEYLLDHLASAAPELALPLRTLIVNDGFGALAIALASAAPEVLSDSCLSRLAIQENQQRNSQRSAGITFLPSTCKLQGVYDVVLIKIPKSLALLEAQLCQLRPHLHADTLIVAAGMVKNIHRSTLGLFEALLGETQSSLARKKARLIFTRPDLSRPLPPCPYPQTYFLQDYALHVFNHANVFCHEKLDQGTRFFLENLPEMPAANTVVDLGCGNGLLGVVFAQRHRQAQLSFVDESYMAVASAQVNFEHAFGTQRPAAYHVGDCLQGFESASVDLILNNPPFHQQTVVGDQVAWQMFNDSRRVLCCGGELWVIGNRHLGYHAKLKRLFGHCDTICSNHKFVILRAVKSATA